MVRLNFVYIFTRNTIISTQYVHTSVALYPRASVNNTALICIARNHEHTTCILYVLILLHVYDTPQSTNEQQLQCGITCQACSDKLFRSLSQESSRRRCGSINSHLSLKAGSVRWLRQRSNLWHYQGVYSNLLNHQGTDAKHLHCAS